MSYDIQVYARLALDSEALHDLVRAASFDVEASSLPSLVVVRGAKSQYTCTLSLPAAVEPEDVPDEVVGVLLAPAFVYDLQVEGSSAVEIPHAVRLARRLAQATEGVVLDQQTGQTWSRGKLRTSPRVEHGLTDVVQLRWYVPAADTGAVSWLDVARRYLPEALPRRFGSYEPLAMSLERDGPDAFVQAVAAGDTIFTKASAPCIEGSLGGVPAESRRGSLGGGHRPVLVHSLVVHRDALTDPRWRDALQLFFVHFAIRTGAFYANAEVQRGLDWTGRTLYHGAEAEHTAYLAPRHQWLGLPPYPVWWSWFGQPYVPLVVDHLSTSQGQRMGDGLFHVRAEEPLDREALQAEGTVVPPVERRDLRRLLSRRPLPRWTGWLPADLLATSADGSLVAAEVVPKRLTG